MKYKVFRRTILGIVTVIFIFVALDSEILAAINVGNKNMSFNRITIQDGLSQASISALFQDSKGYIWIGTADGLNRYDGRKIQVYKDKKDSHSNIIGNYISTINEDLDGLSLGRY